MDIACIKGNMEIVQMAVSRNGPYSATRRDEATRLLFSALSKGYKLEIIECLFAFNVSPNAQREVIFVVVATIKYFFLTEQINSPSSFGKQK